MVEYTKALGLNAIKDESYQFYINPATISSVARSIKAITDKTNKHGIKYGLHTLCGFIRGESSDVRPVPNPDLQTVLRTTLAKSIGVNDTAIIVN
ncbi:MAG: hypothetical protein OSA89_19855 [Mariniblastus sp.]|nr:hypothetical protein [Mariniblastus sp.]